MPNDEEINQTILQEREADYATVRAYELAKTPLEGRFDLDHLQAKFITDENRTHSRRSEYPPTCKGT